MCQKKKQMNEIAIIKTAKQNPPQKKQPPKNVLADAQLNKGCAVNNTLASVLSLARVGCVQPGRMDSGVCRRDFFMTQILIYLFPPSASRRRWASLAGWLAQAPLSRRRRRERKRMRGM